MGNTPNFRLPYPEGSDPPAGHTQMKSLAERIDEILETNRLTAGGMDAQLMTVLNELRAHTGNNSIHVGSGAGGGQANITQDAWNANQFLTTVMSQLMPITLHVVITANPGANKVWEKSHEVEFEIPAKTKTADLSGKPTGYAPYARDWELTGWVNVLSNTESSYKLNARIIRDASKASETYRKLLFGVKPTEDLAGVQGNVYKFDVLVYPSEWRYSEPDAHNTHGSNRLATDPSLTVEQKMAVLAQDAQASYAARTSSGLLPSTSYEPPSVRAPWATRPVVVEDQVTGNIIVTFQ